MAGTHESHQRHQCAHDDIQTLFDLVAKAALADDPPERSRGPAVLEEMLRLLPRAS